MKGFRKLGEPLFAQGLVSRLRIGTRMVAGGIPDTTAPTCTLASTALDLVAGAIAVTATLSEVSTDFDADSLTLVNCAASVAGSGTSYTLTITPTADGTFTVQAAAGGFHDAAGNANTDASNTISRIYLSTGNIWVKSNTGLYKDDAKAVPATADDDLIYTWDNLFSGNDFIQATEGSRPALKIVLGVPYVRADGSDDAIAATIAGDASQTLFIIAKKVSAVGAPSKTLIGLHANGQLYTSSTAGTGFNYYSNGSGNTVVGGGTPASLTYVVLKFTSAAAATLYVNDIAGVDFDPDDGFASATSIILGGAPGGANDGDFDILEFGQCTSALADGPRAALQTYLAARVANPT